MAFQFFDRTQETTTTTGTGTISMGGAVAGYQAFSAAGFATGDTTIYCLLSGNNWEVGLGTLTSGAPWTMARTTILASSNAGAAITLAGTSNVWCDGSAMLAMRGAQQQAIGASVASNALTITSNPCVMDFRSATLTNGQPAPQVIGAQSLVVPSGATLGAISGQQCQLAVIALLNGGAPAIGVVNVAGGVNLDETTLISTTAISASATAQNVVYSTAAITNSPFRVLGYINATEATAGTWATAPSLVQGVGGLSFPANGFGMNQTWQNLTASRAGGTTYYNTTARTIFVLISAVFTTAQVYVNGNYMTQATSGGGSASFISFAVPPGQSYSITGISTASWAEMR